MKKFLLILLLVMAAFPAFSQVEFEQDNLVFTLYQPEGEFPYAEVTGNRLTENTDLVIPSKVSKNGVDYVVGIIGENAFEDCSFLLSLTIPDSVTLIGNHALYGCRSLVSIDIPDSVTSIGSFAFRYCISLIFIDIPDSVTSIGSCAFSNCTSLVSIYIPESVISIGMRAFTGCTSLGSVNIPNSILSFGGNMFVGCDRLKEVNYNTTDPVETEGLFSNETYENATLNVAVGGLAKAKTTSPWMYFKNIREIEFSGVDSPVADSCSDAPVEIYDMNGVYVGDDEKRLAPGMFIVRQGGDVRKIAVK